RTFHVSDRAVGRLAGHLLAAAWAWADSVARPGGSSGPDGSPGTVRRHGGAVPDAANAGRDTAQG
ncbi:hypothetical protein, partial [Mycolicibacterium conceptionense]|uniref:hypothetical protein n=1 Tax=Mycolicibacterium conceptionense TaxID=451644 RepID=UPI001C252F69